MFELLCTVYIFVAAVAIDYLMNVPGFCWLGWWCIEVVRYFIAVSGTQAFGVEACEHWS